MTRWLVRVDSSTHIGSGHVMRCLTLAQQARKRGVMVEFVCRELYGHISQVIRKQGFKVQLLPQRHDSPQLNWREDAMDTSASLSGEVVDWLVVDHYQIEAGWETLLRKHTTHVLVIDDLANRTHDCDVLLDQNYYTAGANRYDALVPIPCIKLLGLRYVLLREEFHRARKSLQRQTQDVSRILINFGGTDEANVTGLVISALQSLKLSDVFTNVVIGITNPNRLRLQWQIGADANFKLHVQIANMAELIAAADLAIGACGSSVWERCYLGLPSIGLVLADNQRSTAEQLAKAGVMINMGNSTTITADLLAVSIEQLIEHRGARQVISENSLRLMTQGITDLAELLLEIGS